MPIGWKLPNLLYRWKMNLWLLGVIVLLPSFAASKTNLIKGGNLRIYFREFEHAVKIQYNQSGYPVQISGLYVERIKLIAKYLGFTFTTAQIKHLPLDNSAIQTGPISYLQNQQVDMIIMPFVMNEHRNRLIDFPFPISFSNYYLLIPIPEVETNISAPTKPFDNTVWILIVFSCAVISLCIFGMTRISKPGQNHSDVTITFNKTIEYVMVVLLSQGGNFPWPSLKLRMLAGVWTLAAFVLVNSYSSVLTSSLTTPTLKPLVDSIFDVRRIKGLKVVADQISGLRTLGELTGSLKSIQGPWNQDASLACVRTEDCMEMVATGNRVYAQGYKILVKQMADDVRAKGHCRFTLAKQPFLFVPIGIALAKNSPYTESMSIGLIRLWEVGFMNSDVWSPENAVAKQCLDDKSRKVILPRISLQHLGGAFLILVVGYGIALIVFILEVLVRKIASRREYRANLART